MLKGLLVLMPISSVVYIFVFWGAWYGSLWGFGALLGIYLITLLVNLFHIKRFTFGQNILYVVSLLFFVLFVWLFWGIYDEKTNTNKDVVREIVLTEEGMTITMNSDYGEFSVTAGEGFTRTYKWGKCERTLILLPRENRMRGAYSNGAGNHWKNCNGITRAVVEESQKDFNNLESLLDFIEQYEKGRPYPLDMKDNDGNPAYSEYNYSYTKDGLFVSWSLAPSRNQLNSDILQLLINGEKPKDLPGASDNIQIK